MSAPIFTMSRTFLLLVLLMMIPTAFATAEPDTATALQTQAHDKNLSQHPYWLALVHYRPTYFNTSQHSEIRSANFFLAKDGQSNPEHELAATLQAFLQPAGLLPDDHAQCKFVARYKWLRANLDWTQTPPPRVACANFEAWTKHGRVDSVSLIFATGYFSNPASFYGHILLKFNANRRIVKTSLLDESLNFGAIVPEHDNQLQYVAKGISGGYEAAFSSAGFYRLNHTYAEDELRNMWEYELALAPAEIEQLSAHSWELLHTQFTYYFFNQNCAYRMTELLSLVIAEPLLPALPWSVPSVVFDHLVALQHAGQPLVQHVRFIPSRLKRFQTQFARLTPSQQKIAQQLVENHLDFMSGEYAQRSAVERISIINTLIDYYQFRSVAEPDQPQHRRDKQRLLIERAQLPSLNQVPVASAAAEAEVEKAPHLAPPPNLVRVGLVHNNVLGNAISLQLRPVYFDSLELEAGRIAHANLTMFDLSLMHRNQNWQLRALDFVKIENLNLASTPLAGEGGAAWRVKLGLQRADLTCQNCTVMQANGGIGRAFAIAEPLIAYGMLDSSLQSHYLNSGTLNVGANIGMLASPNEQLKSSLVWSQHLSLNGNQARVSELDWSNRIAINRTWDVRLNYHRQVANDWQLALSSYW
jgi:Domain of unknown function (DUF4105)